MSVEPWHVYTVMLAAMAGLVCCGLWLLDRREGERRNMLSHSTTDDPWPEPDTPMDHQDADIGGYDQPQHRPQAEDARLP